MPAEPQGAAETAGPVPPVSASGWPGRNGTRCSRTPIGPTPGPPPPCGMQKVLCRLRWLTSEPNRPGRRVEVGAVDVPLPAGVVDGRADLLDLGLEHPVGGGIGEHDRGQPLGVL